MESLKELLKTKGIKQKKLCEVLGMKRAAISYRLQTNARFSFMELGILRKNRIIDLQDLDNLTKDIDVIKK